MSGTLAERSAIASPLGSLNLGELLRRERGEEGVAGVRPGAAGEDAAVAVDHHADSRLADVVDPEAAGHLALPVQEHLDELAGVLGRLLAMCPERLGLLVHHLVE